MNLSLPSSVPGEIDRRTGEYWAALRLDLASPEITAGWARDRLTVEERATADSYVRPEDRRRSAASRALLRSLLGAVLGRPAAELRFATGPHGKPSLMDADLRFSVSHSVDRLLIAFSAGAELGVDVEMRGAKRDLDAAARFAFTADETEALQRLDAPRRELGFLRLWTAKEAALKARGVGLQRPMRDAVLLPAALAALGEATWRPVSASIDVNVFALHDLSAGDDVACLAVQHGAANSFG